MHLNPEIWSWIAIVFSATHDFLYVGLFFLLKKWGVWGWIQQHFPWLAHKPRPLTVAELRDEVGALHDELHRLEEELNRPTSSST